MKEINGDVIFLCGLEEYVDDSNEKFVQNTLNQMLNLKTVLRAKRTT